MTEMVAGGPPDDHDATEIVYDVGPTLLRRLFAIALTPASLGVASLVVALPSLMLIEAANEIGELSTLNSSSGSQLLTAFRFAAGIRLGVALLALLLAVLAARRLFGRRAQVRVSVEALDGDPRTIDAIEADAIALSAEPATWIAMLVGAATVVAVVAVALNGADFGYALATSNRSGGGIGF